MRPPPLYSTYLSGNGVDLATGMAINAGGNVFVTGTTTSAESSSFGSIPGDKPSASGTLSGGLQGAR